MISSQATSCIQEKSSSTWTRCGYHELHRRVSRTSRLATMSQHVSRRARDDRVAHTSLSTHVRERHFLLSSTDCGEHGELVPNLRGSSTSYCTQLRDCASPDHRLGAQALGLKYLITNDLGGPCLFTAEKYINLPWLLLDLSIDLQAHHVSISSSPEHCAW